MKVIRKLILNIYHKMQRHYWSFRILVWLKECGITRKINFLLKHYNKKQMNKVITDEMQRSQAFYDANRKQIIDMLNMLSDEKSKIVWGG